MVTGSNFPIDCYITHTQKRFENVHSIQHGAELLPGFAEDVWYINPLFEGSTGNMLLSKSKFNKLNPPRFSSMSAWGFTATLRREDPAGLYCLAGADLKKQFHMWSIYIWCIYICGVCIYMWCVYIYIVYMTYIYTYFLKANLM